MKRFVPVLAGLFIAAIFGAFGCAARENVVTPKPVAHQSLRPAVSQSQEGPNIVKVGVYVLNVGKLDTSSGAFTIDFYLSFSSDQPSDPGKFEFSNGRADSIDQSVDEPSEKFYRIQASLANSLDLSRYPFDEHRLTIEIEDKEQTSRTQVYQVSPQDSGLDPAVNISGWDLDGWSAEVNEHYYAPYGTSFSRYVFSIGIHRSLVASLLKTLLPALIIVLVGLLSLLLSSDKILARLALSTGSLTGAVLFHLNMTSSLPPLGYLTFADRFMLLNYFAFALTIVSTILALYYTDKNQTPKAQRVHKLSLIIVPVVWAGLQGLNLLLL